MLMRTVHLRLDPLRLLEMRQMYDAVIIGELSHTRGCRFAGLLQSVDHPEIGLSLTLWDDTASVEAYEKGGAYRKLWEQSRPYLAAEPEWTMHLSDDLQLEYVPVTPEPEISRYDSPGAADPSAFVPPPGGRLYLRILSLHVRPGMLEEFTSLYRSAIVSGLRRVPGCRSAFLTAEKKGSRELISVTIWDSRSDAERYEQGGEFAALLSQVGHTLEDSSRWKTVGPSVERVVGSDDMAVSGYALIVGRVFDGTA